MFNVMNNISYVFSVLTELQNYNSNILDKFDVSIREQNSSLKLLKSQNVSKDRIEV